jgi:hypothetical protein
MTEIVYKSDIYLKEQVNITRTSLFSIIAIADMSVADVV